MRVIVIEEDYIIREKIAGLISRMEKVAIVSQMRSCKKLASVVAETKPHLIAIDLGPATRNHSVINEVLRANPDIKIIVYSDLATGVHESNSVMEKLPVREVVQMNGLMQAIQSALPDIPGKVEQGSPE